MTEEEQADCPYFLPSSIQPYAMVKQLQPTQACTPDAADPMYSSNMQMICTNDPFICTYLSPLDAKAEAFAHMPPTVTVEGAAIDQYAIYDPESADWVFTNFN
ncbi:hypothetical protein [Burkholderia sp. Bp8998]|uniref:hypothetical protein n=1 Tax=Burkholderia sp. Bp8998 TaxID=2184557 RepID=UPI000F597202|nr:hypothetical protein [Burkholderia sp. Bp8998]RQS16685.1 hypothetical protein DIE06_20700 [Burkholderia sp. Bp8998]